MDADPTSSAPRRATITTVAKDALKKFFADNKASFNGKLPQTHDTLDALVARFGLSRGQVKTLATADASLRAPATACASARVTVGGMILPLQHWSRLRAQVACACSPPIYHVE